MIVYKGIEWINYQGVLIPDVAPHIKISLSKDDTKYLLTHSNTYFIRWISDWDSPNPTEFWHVIKDGNSSLEELSSNTRHNVRRGLKKCTFKKVKAEIVLREGYEVYRKAFMKYDTFLKPMSEEKFKAHIQSLQNYKEWDFWEARNDEGKMIAYSLNKLDHKICEYKTTKFDPDYQKLYSSEGLFYTMNTYYLNEIGVLYIDDGSRSLSHNTSIQDYFINKFKFRKAYCKLHIAYSFRIKLAVNLLFPFKKLISKIKHPSVQKLLVLLRHEEIRRSFEK